MLLTAFRIHCAAILFVKVTIKTRTSTTQSSYARQKQHQKREMNHTRDWFPRNDVFCYSETEHSGRHIEHDEWLHMYRHFDLQDND